MVSKQTAIEAVRASVCLLADHLDAVLAGGEDLLAIAPAPALGEAPRGHRELQRQLERRRCLVASARTRELAIVARVLKAREHAQSFRLADPRFKSICELFISATHVLVDAARDLGDPTGDSFDTGHDAVGFLRSRGLIGADAAGWSETADQCIGEGFKLAGVVPLGVLLDLVASFLDLLDLTFDLYPADAVAQNAAEEGDGTRPDAAAA